MTPCRSFQFLVFSLLAYSVTVNAGGVVTPVRQTDIIRMEDYTTQDYAESQSARDPFTISDKMYQVSGAQGAKRSGQEFVPFASSGGLPKMRVRGYVSNGPNDARALLQIEGEDTVHLIKQGDRIGLQSRGQVQSNSVLQVLRIDPGRVEVQTGGMRQVIIVQ